MKYLLAPFIFLARHKLLIGSFVVSFIVFVYLFFPFQDLADLVSNQITANSGGAVTANIEDLGISVMPPGLNFKNVDIDAQMGAPIKIDSLAISPSILGALKNLKVLFRGPQTTDEALSLLAGAQAEGLFGGDITVRRSDGEKTKTSRKQVIKAEISSLSLKEMLKLLPLGLTGTATLDGNADADIDPTFVEQPSATISLRSNDVKIDEGTLSAQGFPVSIPALNLKKLDAEVKMDKGSLTITKATLGAPDGDLVATAAGRVDLRVVSAGGLVSAIPGNIDLTIRINFQPSGAQKFATYLPLLNFYKTAENAYCMRMSGNLMMMPPPVKCQ